MIHHLSVARRLELSGLLACAALIIFGVIWLTTVFPGFKKIPTDYAQTVDFQGTYAVVDEQEFLQQLLANASIQRLVASPSTLTRLADPAAQQLLAGNDLKTLLADPALMQKMLTNLPVLAQATDPAIQQMLANPSIRQLLANPTALELLGNPAVQQILADPVAAQQSADPRVQQLLANPLLQQLVADPAVLQAITQPAVQALLANPTLLTLLIDPAVQSLLINPVVPKLLADPVVQGLLTDPSGLALVTDPRTMQLLANPSELPMVQFPVNFHRVREAERADGDVIFLRQDFAATVLGTGQPLDQFSSQATLAVNRKTREYVPGGTEQRRGGFAFPFDVKQNQEHSLWVHEVFQPIPTTFIGEDKVEGLEVVVFQGQVQGLALPNEPKRNLGIPETPDLLADIQMVTKTEPKTGITVDVASHITYRLNNPALGSPVVFDGDIRYSDESIATSVADAQDAQRQLFWFGGFLPWSSISLGLLLGILGGSFVGFRSLGAANTRGVRSVVTKEPAPGDPRQSDAPG